MGERIYIDRVDWDAADKSPLDYIPGSRLRAEEAYEPDHTPTTHDPAVSEWAQLVTQCAHEADLLLQESQPIREHASQADAALRGLSSWRRP